MTLLVKVVSFIFVYGLFTDGVQATIASEKCDEYKQLYSSTATNELGHLVSFGFHNEEKNTTSYVCVGALISKNFALVAAHCLGNRNNNIDRVKYGCTTITAKIKRKIIHPDFKSPIKYNDIALAELEDAAEFKDDIKPACIHITEEILESAKLYNTNLKVTGDKTEFIQIISTIENKQRCSSLFKPNPRLANGIIENQICVLEKSRRDDTCESYGGGPLQYLNKDGEGYTVVSIASFGLPCKTNPEIHSKISAFVSWIESTVWGAVNKNPDHIIFPKI